MIINQEVELEVVSKKIEDLIENTKVDVFNPHTFEGYQRKIEDNHCEKIVKFIENEIEKKGNLLMPSAIICAKYRDNSDNKMNIVDGQHRIEAFKRIKENDTELYNSIFSFSIPVVIMHLERGQEDIEINTFITINKTSKKVDTSLALILRNKLNRATGNYDLTKEKCEFLAVELAVKLNRDPKSIFYNRISFERLEKHSKMTISLNSFVNSQRVFINLLNSRNILDLNWTNDRELNNLICNYEKLFNIIWNAVKNKWENLFKGNQESILIGSIGMSSITKFLIEKIKSDETLDDKEVLSSKIISWINNLNIDEDLWSPGGEYSGYSSYAGYKYISEKLLKN
jgi:DGQHR domain-containing protein